MIQTQYNLFTTVVVCPPDSQWLQTGFDNMSILNYVVVYPGPFDQKVAKFSPGFNGKVIGVNGETKVLSYSNRLVQQTINEYFEMFSR
jgi:hypothetical protein